MYIYCHLCTDKQPLKRAPSCIETVAENVVPQTVKRAKVSAAPSPLKAEPEYVVPDSDGIPIVQVDTLSNPPTSAPPNGLGLLSEEKEPWETFLDELQAQLNSDPSPSSPPPKEEDKEKGGGSLIAQLLSTEKPVREMYKRLENGVQEQRKKSIPSPKQDYDSGYDDSPLPSIDLTGSHDGFNFVVDPVISQTSPRQDLGPISPQRSPISLLSPLTPMSSSTYSEDIFSLPSPYEYKLSKSPLDCGNRDITVEQIFEPARQQCKQHVFSSRPILPQWSGAPDFSQLALESDLVLAEACFNPSMDLGEISL